MVYQELSLVPSLSVAENIFLMRVLDKGGQSECTVVKEGQQGAMDAAEFKTLIKGACP